MRDRAAALWLTHGRPDLSAQMSAQFHGGCVAGCVDNGSPEPIEGALIRLPENGAFSGGWNAAMLRVAGWPDCGYVWMLNDDVLGAGPEAMEEMRRTMAERPRVAAVTPAFNSPHREFHRQGGSLRSVRWVDWCCPLVSLEAWEDVGPFDERFAGYGADLDWCRRARERGWGFLVDDRFELRHLGSQTSDAKGLHQEMRSVDTMNRLLREKWGVDDWSRML